MAYIIHCIDDGKYYGGKSWTGFRSKAYRFNGENEVRIAVSGLRQKHKKNIYVYEVY